MFNIFPTKKFLSDIYLFDAWLIKKLILLKIANLSHQYIYLSNTYPFSTHPTSTDLYNAYSCKKFASAGMAMSMNIMVCHFISLLFGGNGNENKENCFFPLIFLQN